MNLPREIESLFKRQLNEWELARTNYAGLHQTRVSKIPFQDFNIMLQFNPKRIISSSAKVDPLSVSARPCFLCKQNRPPEQVSIGYHDGFEILVNPYPVFHSHLTVPSSRHEPQRILPNFGIMLEIARDLPSFIIIYNGPQCGASAPDHFHFQAVQKGQMPVEDDFSGKRLCIAHHEIQGVGIYTWNNYLRKLITLQGKNAAIIEAMFQNIHRLLQQDVQGNEEPMMNILAGCYQDHFVIHLFPRKSHRPDRFFASGDRQLLLSPASIDMGGVLIFPREEDFRRITGDDITDIFRQVCVEDKFIQDIVNRLICMY